MSWYRERVGSELLKLPDTSQEQSEVLKEMFPGGLFPSTPK
jgi:hypothetical protein